MDDRDAAPARRFGGSQGTVDYVPVPSPRGAVVLAHAGAEAGLRQVAGILNRHRLDTLLIDLHAADGGLPSAAQDDVDRLVRRLVAGLAWLQVRPATGGRAAGVYAVSAAAAAALSLAARHPGRVAALVACSARVDLVGAPVLQGVSASTLLIVGGLDTALVRASRDALRLLPGARRLEVLPRTHGDFEAPGTLEAAAHLGAHWLALRLGGPAPP